MGKVTKTVPKRKRNKETGEMETVGSSEKEIDVHGLKLSKYYDNDIATDKLVKRVWDTMNIFKSVINMEIFTKYHLKSNKIALEQLLTIDN